VTEGSKGNKVEQSFVFDFVSAFLDDVGIVHYEKFNICHSEEQSDEESQIQTIPPSLISSKSHPFTQEAERNVK